MGLIESIIGIWLLLGLLGILAESGILKELFQAFLYLLSLVLLEHALEYLKLPNFFSVLVLMVYVFGTATFILLEGRKKKAHEKSH